MTARPFLLAARGLALGAVVGLLALLVWRVAHASGTNFPNAVDKGKKPTAPAFTLDRLVGHGSISLASLRGHPVVLDFWASWCIPCGQEAPRFERAYERYRSQGVVFLGVDTMDVKSDARRWLRRYGITFPTVRDGDGKVFRRYGGFPIPRTYFIDRNGKTVGQMVVEEDLDRYLKQIAKPA